MRAFRLLTVLSICAACTPPASDAPRDTAAPATAAAPPAAAPAELSSDSAVSLARRLVIDSKVAEQVYLDSVVMLTREQAVWRVAFRRRALAAPMQMTIDVDRRTGAARFLGDE